MNYVEGKVAYESIHVRWKLGVEFIDAALMEEIATVKAQVKATVWEAECIHCLCKSNPQKKAAAVASKYPTGIDFSMTHRSLKTAFMEVWESPECVAVRTAALPPFGVPEPVPTDSLT